ncbi:hypothetical protein K435DRAFT_791468 [Dendrothele bispora CBS 962.96]|uniref:Uncharacterized protein n=1 Tax=Dendrothele bispora (strain CBS 962.96) TaxID=1314807 RepID=A0A4V4HHT6_DENBC|nr:hypothetical protein K435DRAFT_791468 [Dendrothele bispora CBS 962.96]
MFALSKILCTILPLLALLASAAPAVPSKRQDTSGTIVLPTEGTVINPGQAFDFSYDARGDYGVTSYNYTVFLFTSTPGSFSPSEEFARGHFFGRFSNPNFPGNPNPSNPPPAQLIMPDFSKNPGGFGTGAVDSDGKFQIAVLEEYADGDGTVGLRMSLAMTSVVYNASTTATTTAT